MDDASKSSYYAVSLVILASIKDKREWSLINCCWWYTRVSRALSRNNVKLYASVARKPSVLYSFFACLILQPLFPVNLPQAIIIKFNDLYATDSQWFVASLYSFAICFFAHLPRKSLVKIHDCPATYSALTNISIEFSLHFINV